MGKKVEKVLKPANSEKNLNASQTNTSAANLGSSTASSSRNLASANLNSNNQKSNKSQVKSETFKLTGKFKEDYENVSTAKNVKYMPEIICRNNPVEHRTNAPDAAKNEKAKPAGKNAKGADKEPVAPTEDPDQAENSDAPPKTFTLREPYEYFKPKIQVEMDNPEKQETVTELHIKGWKLEKPLMEVFQHCLPRADRLNTINFWNCGLEEETVRILSSILPECQNLKTVILDSNPISTPCYHTLIYEENTNLQILSLRNNRLDDEAMEYIGFALGDLKKDNRKIVSLNLNNNLIGDKGAKALARGLRTNRTLLTLSVANNQIGDDGAKTLSEVLSRFPLTHDEIVHRRKVISGRNFERSQSPPSRRGNDSKERPASQKSTVNLDKKKEKSAKKDSVVASGVPGPAGSVGGSQKNSKDANTKAKKDDKQVRKDKGSIESKNSKQPKVNPKQSGKRSAKETSEVNKALLEISALTDVAENLNDELWLAGNRALINLNLSKNNLTEKTVDYFLSALAHQKNLTDIHKGFGQGIMRLVLTYNNFNSEYDSYVKLNDFLKQKDPFYKAQMDMENADKASIHSGKESKLGNHKGSKH